MLNTTGSIGVRKYIIVPNNPQKYKIIQNNTHESRDIINVLN